MADYPFKADSMEREWHFTLTDPILECNQGAFRLCISQNGQGRAERISEPCADQISIQTMTTMLMGYKRPDLKTAAMPHRHSSLILFIHFTPL